MTVVLQRMEGPSVRVVLVAPGERTLLLRRQPLALKPFWTIPGLLVPAGRSAEDTAGNLLTALEVPGIAPGPVRWHRVVQFVRSGELVRQVEDIFRVPVPWPVPHGRWVGAAEIAGFAEPTYPRNLAELVRSRHEKEPTAPPEYLWD